MWLVAGTGGVVLTCGVAAVIFAKTIKGKIAALALPVFAVAGLTLGNPHSAQATSGPPSVAIPVTIGSTYAGSLSTLEITTAPDFNNPENCGARTFQWQTLQQGGQWTNQGAATSNYAPYTVNDCLYMQGRLVVTFTNNSGSVSSTSNASTLCSN